jgi:hypothetical protein
LLLRLRLSLALLSCGCALVARSSARSPARIQFMSAHVAVAVCARARNESTARQRAEGRHCDSKWKIPLMAARRTSSFLPCMCGNEAVQFSDWVGWKLCMISCCGCRPHSRDVASHHERLMRTRIAVRVSPTGVL